MEITQHRDGGPERRAVTAMIVSKPVLAAIAARWDRELFSSRWASLVGGWCVGYFQKYGKAPGPNIERLFDAWAESGGKDPATVKLVEKFLLTLSGAYERERKRVNPAHAIDEAAAHFRDVGLDKLKDRIQAALEDGDGAKAQELVEAYRRVEMGQAAGCHPLDPATDLTGVVGGREDRSLIRYPGALGEFFAHAIERDSLIGFMAGEKRGKSFALFDVAYRAARQGRRVAWFVVGDMSEAQVKRRLVARVANRPVMKDTRVIYPKQMEAGGGVTDSTPTAFPEDMTEGEVRAALKRVAAKCPPDRLWLSVHPKNSISVDGIESALETRSRDGWDADFVIIDYSANLAPPNPKAEKRDQVDEIWGAMSTLRQKRHCVVVSATQCNRAGYTADVLERSHIPEDKRILAHVTGLVGINPQPKNKDAVVGLNWVASRELDFPEDKLCYCATCLPCANPFVVSTF